MCGWRTWLLVGLAVGCGSKAKDDPDAPHMDGPDHPPGRFPLHVAPDGSSLVSENGMPFLLHGEAAWSLIVEVPTQDAERYLADRDNRGITAVIVSLIEHEFASDPPKNYVGDAPFTTAGDFSTPNEAYFAHADNILDRAAAHGMAVLLFPSYLGFDGGSEGWFQTMSALPAAKCRQYGDFVGARYAKRTNIIWMWGGDYTPEVGSPGETCMRAIADGIRAAAPSALASAHWAPETTSRAVASYLPIIDLVGAYTYKPALPFCRSARAESPRKPTFLLETTYENEHDAPVSEIRRQQWWGMLGCGGGEISGNNPIWKFGSGWPNQLGSSLSKHQARLGAVIGAQRWHELALDDALVTARGSDAAEIAATRTGDGKAAVIYIPPAGASSITVDLARLTGPVDATWYDPTSDAHTPAGTTLVGSHAFATPGKNAAGDGDWVLVLVAR